jgi:predicted permease
MLRQRPVRWLFWRHRAESELDDELRAYLDLLTTEKIRSGMSSSEARRAALIETGGIDQVKELCRDVRPFHWLDSVGKDLHYAARLLRRTPGFTAAVVLMVTLGVGAITAAFSLFDALLLKSLPVQAPHELVWFRDPSFSYPIFQEVQSRGKDIFSGLFAWNIETLNIEWNQDVEQSPVLFVTGDSYTTLGISAAAGRMLTSSDDTASSAVISYDAWQRRFGRAANVIGKTIRIERTPFTIVGITPEGFFGVAPGLAPEITLSLTRLPDLRPNAGDLRSPSKAWLHMLGRLKPGLPREQANAAVQVFWPQIMEAVTPVSMPRERRTRYLERRTELVSGHAGFSRVRNQFSEPLLVILCLAGLLLLAACASIANLLLVRGSARRREISVRLAIGATRGRLIRQFLIESLLITSLGAAGALLFANWGCSLLVRLMATTDNPITVDLSLDWRVLAFTATLSLATTVVAVLVTTLRTAAVDPGTGLKESPRAIGPGPRRSRLAKLLVIAQVALAVLLLSGASLFVRSLRQLVSLHPGFDHRNVLLVNFDPLLAGYRDARLTAFYAIAQERLGAMAGVESVSLSWVPPVSDRNGAWTQSIGVDGAPPQAASQNSTFFNVVSPGYFSTIGQRLIRGRDFSLRDTPTAPRVCIISDSVARTFFPDRDPIGRHISIGTDLSRQSLEIIGIVEDAKYQRLREQHSRTAYLFYLQMPGFLDSRNLMAEVRTAVPPATLIDPLRRDLRALDPKVLLRFETLSERIRESLVTERVVAIISGFLGVAALLLAAAGLYGLLAYTVSTRTGEIGIRMALGAAQPAVRWLVMKDCLVLSIMGVTLGLAAALVLGRFAGKLLYGLTPDDPLALGSAVAMLQAIALAAAFIPARRATRIDPIVALRHD